MPKQLLCFIPQDQYRGLHKTYYVKKVYRHDHDSPDMVIPDSQIGGFKFVSSFRYFNCKKNRFVIPHHSHQISTYAIADITGTPQRAILSSLKDWSQR